MDDLDLDLRRQIDVVCSQFERDWRNRFAPRIEDYLLQIPAPGRDCGLCELILVEIDLTQSAGEHVDIAHYFERFPGHKQLVQQATSPIPATRLDPQLVNTADDGTRVYTPKENQDGIKTIGRYRIEKQIGQGSFGVVYLATDTELPRQVVLKVARADRVQTSEERQSFVRDAEYATRLKHPNILTIYDVEPNRDQPFIVLEYMPGGDLKRRLIEQELSCHQAVSLMIPIAEAVAFAHQKDIFHRDLKPANILLDERGEPRVADFGLALHERDQQKHRDEYAGTLPYMSPEQVRRESHRLDGRSDTWSLGVIFYEMLTGRCPFLGKTDEIRDQIKFRDPRPPRELKPELPAELERICLKCLEKTASQRYFTARDLAQDLRLWQQDQHAEEIKQFSESEDELPEIQRPARIIPKGLRSFDARDADFFLELLPGPRDRTGLPDTVRFWKGLIEETDVSRTFAVGVLHGPSGCGKSSFLKAGVLPRLPKRIAPVFVEATADDTEVRLLRGLRKVYWPESATASGIHIARKS